MSLDLIFYTKKFSKEEVLPFLEKVKAEKKVDFKIGNGFFEFEKQGDNFELDGDEIYAETGIEDFDASSYIEENEMEDYEDEDILEKLKKCDLEISFSCHGKLDIDAVSYFLMILTLANEDALLYDTYEGEYYFGQKTIDRLQEIQAEYDENDETEN